LAAGLCRTRWGSLGAPQTPATNQGGPTSKGKEGRDRQERREGEGRKRGRGRDGEGKERDGK